LIYVWVESVQAALDRTVAHGGEIVEGSHPDQPGTTCYIATIRDPAGNQIALYHEETMP
jgi:predicted enzyme related to lactoylglutathione lyase